MTVNLTYQSLADFTIQNPLMNSSSRTIHPVDPSLLPGAPHAEIGCLIKPPVNPEITGFTIAPYNVYGDCCVEEVI